MLRDIIDRCIKPATIIVTLMVVGFIIAIIVVSLKPLPPATKDLRESFIKDNPIVTNLPYINPYYSIEYKTAGETSNEITLTIRTPSPRYRYEAVKQIRGWGFDPTSFKIEFIDYKNPLEVS